MLLDNPTPRRLLLLAMTLAVPAARAAAQAALPAEPTVWLTYAGEHAITSGGTALVLDAHVRRGDAFTEWRQLLVRTGLSRGVGRHVRVSAGWAYLRSFADAERGVPFATWDHRAWQMVQLSHGAGRLTLQHRVRLEQRFFDADATPGPGDQRFAWRGRYQFRATLPIAGSVSAVGSQDVFLPFGPHEGTPEIDQSRTNAGLGVRLAPALRMELGYLNRAAVDHGRVRTRDHALQGAIASSVPLLAGRRRPAP